MPKFQVSLFLTPLTYVVDAEDKDEACEKAHQYAVQMGLNQMLRRAELEVELFDE
jgi:hypothetical protein